MPLLLVLDGNSLLHRAYHAGSFEGMQAPDGSPIWALRGLVGYLARAAAHLSPDAVIVGFDDVPEAAYFTPPLTTVRPDFAAVATASLELLMEQVSGAVEGGKRRTVAPELIERDSVAPPAV